MATGEDTSGAAVRRAVERLHAEVDGAVAPLAAGLADRLECRLGCTRCCVDELTVFEVEAERIRAHHGALLSEGEPHPAGACAFLGPAGECRIYEHRPYVCRTQGLPLRWLDEHDGAPVELRDICPLNEVDGAPIEHLPAESCWTLGPFEARLADLQHRAQGRSDGPLRRVGLRSLFRRG